MRAYAELTQAALAEISGALASVDPQAVHALGQSILDAKRVFLAGKGRSGLQMRAFAMRLMHMGMTVYVVDDVTTPAITSGDLLLLGSGSGRTPSIVNYAQKARAVGARVGLISISLESPAAEQSDVIVRIDAPTPKRDDTDTSRSILPMGSLFEASLGLLFDVLSVQLMDAQNLTSDGMFVRHANLE